MDGRGDVSRGWVSIFKHNKPGDITMKNLSIAFALVVGSVAGCAQPQVGEVDEPVTETSSAITTGTFRLHNFQTGLCLGVAAENPAYGTPLITWSCDGSPNQNWTAVQKNASYYQLKSAIAAEHCADAQGNTNGTQAKTNFCWTICGGSSGSPPTVTLPGWKLLYAGNDFSGHECYRLQHEGGLLVLGVSGGNTNRGANTILWTDYNNTFSHPDQFWCTY